MKVSLLAAGKNSALRPFKKKKKKCIFRDTFNFDIFKTEHMPRFELTVNGKRAAVLVPN